MSRIPLYVLEGAWQEKHEQPQALSYFSAYALSEKEIDLKYRTFRCAEDLEYYIKTLPKNGKAFLYIACHGNEGALSPSDGRSKIDQQQIVKILTQAKKNSIAYMHFSCCELFEISERRPLLEKLKNASGAKFVSGYANSVDWLASTLLDLALVSRVSTKRKPRKLENKLNKFKKSYNSLIKELKFSAVYESDDQIKLFPPRIA